MAVPESALSPSLALVVCTYNRSASLIDTLRSIYASGYTGRTRVTVLVVANACTDDTLTQLEAFRTAHPSTHLDLDWIAEPRAGKSWALNAAIAHTSHDVLCFIDDDQTVEAGFIDALLNGTTHHPDEAIYCGRIWPAWDGSEPDWVHTEGDYAIPIRPFPEFDLGPASAILPPGARLPSGGNIAVRREVFAAIGNFSIDLGPTGHNLAGGEDHDFLRRAVAHGFRLRYLPVMRQLHAVDAARMETAYTLRKSFSRSRAQTRIRPDTRRPRLFMFTKALVHLGSALFTLDARRRFFYMVRLAASLGELAGAFDSWGARRHARLPLPADRGMIAVELIGLITAASALTAWFAAGSTRWAGIGPVLVVAAIGTAALLVKSVLDYSQTGPRIREEILTHYRRYSLYALGRLALWSLALMSFTGGLGVLVYAMGVIASGLAWSDAGAMLAAVGGIIAAFTLQFLRKLRFNPGLLVASMHYRASRLYPLWKFATPARLRTFQGILIVSFAVLLFASSSALTEAGRLSDLVALWAASLAYAGMIVWSAWTPDAHPLPRRTTRPSDTPPNIVMIGSDTLRADRLGAFGYRRTLTPHIDRLGDAGALFTNCYVPCARTAPSLISLFTGTWPHTHGVRDNFARDEECTLRPPALPSLLKQAGYRTAVISDWCGADMGKFSFGFDHVDLPQDQWNLKYLIRQGPKDLRLYLSLFTHNRLGRLLLPEVYYLGGVPMTRTLGRRARRLISRLAPGEQPFMLNVFYSTTHPPFASEWPYYTRFADPAYRGESKFAMARLTDPFEIIRRQGQPKEEFDLDQIIDLYDGCVAAFDDEVGQMLAHLDACGLSNNTLVVVYSDHGMEFFEHDTWGQGNSAVGEASPRIPLVIRDPRLPARGRIDEVVRTIDFSPTLLDLVGQPCPESMEGTALTACLKADSACPTLDAFNETGIWIADIPGLPDAHLRYPNLLELLEVPDRESGTLAIKPEYCARILVAKDRMIRSGKWKLVCQPLETGVMLRLFDVESDPACRDDLALQHPEVTERLLARLAAWIPARETGPHAQSVSGDRHASPR